MCQKCKEFKNKISEIKTAILFRPLDADRLTKEISVEIHRERRKIGYKGKTVWLKPHAVTQTQVEKLLSDNVSDMFYIGK